MTIHTKWLVILLSGILLFGGCHRRSMPGGDYPGTEAADTALVDIVLALRCNGMTSKAVNPEEQINDLNLFFVHKYYPSPATPEVRHYYFSSADIAKHIKLTNIRLGKYRLYAVANAGAKLCSDSHDPETPSAVGEGLCSMNEVQIKALVVGYSHNPNKAENLLMSSVDPDMVVKRSDATLPTITINLERKMSKIDFSYELVGPAVGNMEVSRIEAKSIPYQVAPFIPNTPTTGGYEDHPVQEWGTPNADAAYASTYYLPENMQGEVTGISSEQDRNAQKAPSNASYLYLDGKYKGNQYGMSIYFGESMTGGNFDLEGNTHYQLHLALGGPDVNDARVSSLKINSSDFPASFKKGEEAFANIEIICNNYFNDEITLICAAVGGKNKTFRVRLLGADGNETGEDLSFDIMDGDFWYTMLKTDNTPGEKRIKCRVYYSQPEASPSGSSVTMVFKLQTRYGMSTFKTQDVRITNL